jgi:hypothetical protein
LFVCNVLISPVNLLAAFTELTVVGSAWHYCRVHRGASPGVLRRRRAVQLQHRGGAAACGSPGATTVCGDPSKYVHWDGVHLTEAAYKYIANGWLNGLYAYPSILDLAQ